jgi:hypothetical protein
MRFGYNLNHIYISSLLYVDLRLLCPIMGMLIRNFVQEDPSAHNIMIINFADYGDKWLH